MRAALVALIPTLFCVAVIGYALHATGYPVIAGVAGAWPFLCGVYVITYGCALFALTEEE